MQTNIMLALGFSTLACLTTIVLGVLVWERRLGIHLGIVVNTVLTIVWFGLMGQALGTDFLPALCMLSVIVPQLDLILVVLSKFSGKRSEKTK